MTANHDSDAEWKDVIFVYLMYICISNVYLVAFVKNLVSCNIERRGVYW